MYKTDIEKNLDQKNAPLQKYDIAMGIILLSISIIFAWSVRFGITAGVWYLPIILSIVWIMQLSVFAMTVSKRGFAQWCAFAGFFPLVVFFFSYIGLLCVTIGAFIGMAALMRARALMLNGREIFIGPALRVYIGSLIFALSLITAAFFYSHIVQKSALQIVPRISDVYGIDAALQQFVGSEGDAPVTVDSFIEQRVKATATDSDSSVKSESGLPTQVATDLFKKFGVDPDAFGSVENIANAPRVQFDAIARDALRAQLGASLGQELSGTENITDVFKGFLDKKIQLLLASNPVIAQTLAEVLSLILFFTLLSIGSLLKHVWVWATQ